MSDYFPHEVLVEILLRLPVKPLLKCRCVSKTWHSIISDPNFITAHLSRTLTKTNNNNNNNNNMVLFQYCYGVGVEKEDFVLHNDTTETFGAYNVPLNCPHKSITLFLTIVGSCNGVLCLADDYCWYNPHGFAFWNPSINKLVTVPPPNIALIPPNVTLIPHGAYMHSLGFGFDAVNNDYKIVRVVYVAKDYSDYRLKTPPPLVEIFSLRSGSWRDVSAIGPNYVIEGRSLQAFMNGACHWLAHSPEGKGTFVNVIVSFDFEKEIFSEIKVPESLVEVHGLNMVVAVLGGSLGIVPHKKEWREEGSVWVMKEYGAAESWSKLFNINIDLQPELETVHGELQKVVAFRKNGEVLVVTEDDKLLSYDPKNQEFLDIGICGHPRSFYFDTYVESLVLLNEANRELRDQANSSNAGENKNKKENGHRKSRGGIQLCL